MQGRIKTLGGPMPKGHGGGHSLPSPPLSDFLLPPLPSLPFLSLPFPPLPYSSLPLPSPPLAVGP